MFPFILIELIKNDGKMFFLFKVGIQKLLKTIIMMGDILE